MSRIIGTSGDDYLNGTPNDDVIKSFAGNDYIIAGAGNDYIDAGGNNGGWDSIDPGTGFDTIDFSSYANGLGFVSVSLRWYDPMNGPDPDAGLTVVIDGDNNFGFIRGQDINVNLLDVSNAMLNMQNSGLQILTGANEGDDEFWVNPGEDRWLSLAGGGGNDSYYIGEGLIRLNYGGLGSGITANLNLGLVTKTYEFSAADGVLNFVADTISGSGQVHELWATNFDDKVVGSRNDERFTLGQGNDVLNGKGGIDLIRYDRGGVGPVDVDLAKGVATGTWQGQTFNHKLRNIENVRGSNFENDTIAGDKNDNLLDGKGGNDTLLGRGGDDTLIGNDDSDRLDGGIGDDTLTGGAGLDKFIFRGNFGNDRITDFNALNGGEDINLRGVASITSYSDLVRNHMSQVGADVVIDAGEGNTITLVGISLFNLDRSDFIF